MKLFGLDMYVFVYGKPLPTVLATCVDTFSFHWHLQQTAAKKKDRAFASA